MRQSKNILVLCVTLFTMCIISSCSSSKKTVVVDEFYEPIVVPSKTDTLSNKLEAEVQQWLGVPYKYGGQMTLLGYLTNIVNSSITQTDENIFRTFPSIINTFMLSFFNKTEIKIIHPVAIYY